MKSASFLSHLAHWIVLALLPAALAGQPADQLLCHLSFDDCMAEDVSGNDRVIVTNGSPGCDCSPEGMALRFDGSGDNLVILDSTDFFQLAFSFSFYFKPDPSSQRHTIMSMAESCTDNRGLFVTYDGATHSVTAEFSENIGKKIFLSAELDPNRCWHHVTVERSGERNAIHLYGEKVAEVTNQGFIDFANPANITIGDGPCVGMFTQAYSGLIDEVRFYSRTFAQRDIRTLYRRTQYIETRDTLIFLGEGFTPQVNSDCIDFAAWQPTAGVSAPSAPEPFLSPEETTLFILTMREEACELVDSLEVIVIDPSEVECDKLLLPSAFTPNNDGLNDRFFISNGFILDELISFDIYDRWGAKLFSTSNSNEGWDGTFKGQTVMPGVYIYKAKYICEGEERVASGSFSVLN